LVSSMLSAKSGHSVGIIEFRRADTSRYKAARISFTYLIHLRLSAVPVEQIPSLSKGDQEYE
jgi:hypothetical protein